MFIRTYLIYVLVSSLLLYFILSTGLAVAVLWVNVL